MADEPPKKAPADPCGSDHEPWWSDTDVIRFVVAMTTIAAVFVLLLAAVFIGGDQSALVTGLLAVLTGVLAFYFGSQGLASAQRTAVNARVSAENVAGKAEDYSERIAVLEKEGDLARQALGIALKVAKDNGLQQKLEDELQSIEEGESR